METRVLVMDDKDSVILPILYETEWIIELLIIPKNNKKYYKCDRIKNILYIEDIWFNDDLTGFDYNVLRDLVYAKERCLCGTLRYETDHQMCKWNFYRGMAVLLRKFQKNRFDFVLVVGPNHGRTNDTAIVEIANYYNIPSFNIEEQQWDTLTVFNNLAHKPVYIGNKDADFLKNTMHYDSGSRPTLSLGNKKKRAKRAGMLKFDIAETIKSVNYDGNIYDRDKKDSFGRTLGYRLRQFTLWKKYTDYYNKISVQIDRTRKSICYFIHFEPEAVLGGIAMDSQIVAINMLSSLLPKGWILYVKEHPDTFKLNNSYFYLYFNEGAGIYKSIKFYREIRRMKNVLVLDKNISSDILVKQCQGIATFSGTVAMEALMAHKPVMLFGGDRYIYSLSECIYKIRSYDDCRHAMKEIYDGRKINDTDIHEMERIAADYLIPNKANMGYRKAISVINREIICGTGK